MSDREWALVRVVFPIGALGLCAAVEPHHPPAWTMCPFKILTGIPCPFCGMTRGVASLLRQRWSEAIGYHLFSPLVLAVIVAWIVVELGRLAGLWQARQLGDAAIRPGPWLAFAGVCAVYGVLRWWGIMGYSRI